MKRYPVEISIHVHVHERTFNLLWALKEENIMKACTCTRVALSHNGIFIKTSRKFEMVCG